MIADLDETIRKLLTSEMSIREDEVEISFDQPKREWSARLSSPTLNFYLYNVRENLKLRQQTWEKVNLGSVEARRRHAQKRTALRVDCSYMITAWATEAEDEHNLLSACLMTLMKFPMLPKTYLSGALLEQPYNLAGRLASPEDLPNISEIWGVLDNEMRPTVPYVITLTFDPWTVESTDVVRSAVLRLKDAEKNKVASEKAMLAGTVISAETQAPLSNITVALQDTGYVGRTDGEGRYKLGYLVPGDYMLVAWPPESEPVRRSVKLPGDKYDFEL